MKIHSDLFTDNFALDLAGLHEASFALRASFSMKIFCPIVTILNYFSYTTIQDSGKLEPFLSNLEPFCPGLPLLQVPEFVVDPKSQETRAIEEQYLRVFSEICSERKGKSELKWSLLQLF